MGITFADEALIEVRSGKGGNGCVAFRREKYVPMGGPAGGDGGRGGDVVFYLKNNLRTLSHLRYKRVFKAQNGLDGEGGNRHGRDGEDALIPVPPGTTLKDPETGEIIFDFGENREQEVMGSEQWTETGEQRPTPSILNPQSSILPSSLNPSLPPTPYPLPPTFTYLTGGKGGWGNSRFKTSVNQAPRFAHEGTPGETKKILVELSVMADVGLVGFPNAGKSSLLDYFTNARPKIAPYPFTTKIPNLGVLRTGGAFDEGRDIVIADIPGIIEGAAEGAGLGITFLKHISRCQALLLMIDCSDDSCLGAYDILLDEISRYDESVAGGGGFVYGGRLAGKKRIVLCNKIDVEGAYKRAKKTAELIRQKAPREETFLISIHERKGLKAVEAAIVKLVETDSTRAAEISARAGGAAGFLQSRSVADYREEQFPGDEKLSEA
ncbi:MAG: GTPase ObgE [Treponemataceae bacterium]|nr:MAG: GTPase ObgE [Treponemataceae bacterium]